MTYMGNEMRDRGRIDWLMVACLLGVLLSGVAYVILSYLAPAY